MWTEPDPETPEGRLQAAYAAVNRRERRRLLKLNICPLCGGRRPFGHKAVCDGAIVDKQPGAIRRD